VSNSNSEWKDQDEEGMQRSLALLRRDSVQDLFREYFYDEAFNIQSGITIPQRQPTTMGTYREEIIEGPAVQGCTGGNPLSACAGAKIGNIHLVNM